MPELYVMQGGSVWEPGVSNPSSGQQRYRHKNKGIVCASSPKHGGQTGLTERRHGAKREEGAVGAQEVHQEALPVCSRGSLLLLRLVDRCIHDMGSTVRAQGCI